MLTRILSAFGYERRVTDHNPAFAPDLWPRPLPLSGFVTPNKVMSNLAVAVRCVSLRSELLASQPLKIYRKLPNGDRERVTDTPLSDVLADLANPLMTAFELREFLVRSLDTAGNAYARIERNGNGQVIALWPLAASSVQVERLESGRLRYRVSAPGAKQTVLLQEEVLHIRASSEDGLVGRSPISIARGSLQTAIAQNEAAETLASNGLRPAAAFTHPGKLSDNAIDNIQSTYMAQNAGPHNAGKPLVLQEGMTIANASFSAEDAELLESRKLSNEDVARIFGVPPASVGISTSVSYGSAQQAAADLVSNALAPLAARVEQALQRCLLSTEARRTTFIEHDLSDLLRGDASTRWSTYRIAREIGALTNNQILRFENLPGYDGGDEHTPLSLQARGETPTASER
jgi:HK97 family phage portal protein